MKMKRKAVTCYGRVIGRDWCQEWYETASRDAAVRARQLRERGYSVVVSPMGHQVTGAGSVRMTLVSVMQATREAVEAMPRPDHEARL